MSSLVVSEPRALTGPIQPDRPSGDSMEYDSLFAAMERAACGREEQQFGQTVIEEQPPQWAVVRELATKLLQKTHDLRIGVYLTESLIDSDGLTGFSETLRMIADWLKDEWDTVHPQLEADEQWDPTIRLNTLTRLTDTRRIIRRLLAVPLCEVRGLGCISVGSLLQLAESMPTDAETVPPAESAISAAPVDSLLKAMDVLRDASDAVTHLDGVIVERVGVARSVEFAPLEKVLKMATAALSERMQRRGIRAANPAKEAVQAESKAEPKQVAAPVSAPTPDLVLPTEPAIAPNVSRLLPASPRDWAIHCREDVTAVLDRLCDYFAQHEPSSPIPLLLARAKRLVPMGFLEILQELGPDFLAQAQRLHGSAAASR